MSFEISQNISKGALHIAICELIRRNRMGSLTKFSDDLVRVYFARSSDQPSSGLRGVSTTSDPNVRDTLPVVIAMAALASRILSPSNLRNCLRCPATGFG